MWTIILGLLFVLIVVLIVVGYLGYSKFIKEERGKKGSYETLKNVGEKHTVTNDEVFEKCATFPELIEYRTEKTPNRICFIPVNSKGEELERISYIELLEIFMGLKRDYFGKLKGKKAIIIMQPGVEYNIVFLALVYAGVVAVPVFPPKDYKKSIPEVVSIADNCGAKYIVSTKMIHGKISLAFLGISQEFNPTKYKWIDVPSVPKLLKKYSSRNPKNVKKNKRRIRKKSKYCELLKKKPKKEDLAYLQYTSGSTSAPKGVMISHGNIMRQIFLLLDKYMKTPFIGIAWLPAYHSTGLIIQVFQQYVQGGTWLVLNPYHYIQDPRVYFDLFTRYKATRSIMPNFGFSLANEKITDKEVKQYRIPKDASLVCGAEPILASTMLKFTNKFNFHGICNGYGLSEFTLAVSMTKSSKVTIEKFDRKKLEKGIVKRYKPEKKGEEDKSEYIELVACGEVMEQIKFAIIDHETKKVLPGDRVGEICVSDESKAMGYYKNPEATKKTFQNAIIFEDGTKSEPTYLATGDLGFLFENRLYISGRIKDIIIIRGRNLHEYDVEKLTSSAHDYLIQSCAVAFSVSHYKGVEEEQLVIVSEVKKEFEKADLEPVFAAIRKEITASFHVIPSYVVLVSPNSLIRTSSHKISRTKMKNKFIAGELEGVLQIKEYKSK